MDAKINLTDKHGSDQIQVRGPVVIVDVVCPGGTYSIHGETGEMTISDTAGRVIAKIAARAI